jgi:hypothetical protein
VKRRRKTLIALGILGAALVAYAARIAVWHPAPLLGSPVNDGRTRVPGIIHVHTTLSDGGGTPEEVIAAAKGAGVRFLVITDHNNLDAKPFEGDRGGLLVIVGTEVSTSAGHVLGLGVDDPVYRFSGDATDALEDIRDLGGVAIAAHPLSPRADFAWTGWNLPGWRGLELLNGDSQWRTAGWWRLARTLLAYKLNPSYALLSSLTPPDEALARFDTLLRERDVVGIAGADAHSRVPVRKNWAVRFPSYESLFRLMRNYVVLDAPLSGDAKGDSRAILSALAAGRSYIAVEALAPGSEFSFEMTDGLRRWTLGDTVTPVTGLRLTVTGSFPAGARAVIFRDGNVLAESHEFPLTVASETPGAYRAEVHLPGWRVPWIVSNAIYVFDEAARQARVERGAWPSPEPVPESKLVLGHFDSPTNTLSAEHDPASSMPASGFSLGAGHDGSGSLAFPCDLGQPTPTNPDVFCALITRTPPDLSPFHGLSLWVRGDGEFRMWIQLRDHNAASADNGLEHWYASVRATREWRHVAVPFSRFHSFNPRTDGRLDPGRVKELAFIVDKGTMKTGASARTWIDDVAFY